MLVPFPTAHFFSDTLSSGTVRLFPLLAFDVLPAGVFGIFMTGIIATLMSTIDSLGLISAITFGRDILWRIQGDHQDSDNIPFIKKGLIIVSFLSLLLAYLMPSIVQQANAVSTKTVRCGGFA